MRTVSASIVVPAPPVEAEQLWHDRSRWASWIDDFGHVAKLEGDWPQAGARRMWVSRGGWGRGSGGLVSETVAHFEAGRGVTLRVEDSRLAGLQRVRFEGGADATRITLELEVAPKERMPPARAWWLRRKLADSLRRTLVRFSYELAAER